METIAFTPRRSAADTPEEIAMFAAISAQVEQEFRIWEQEFAETSKFADQWAEGKFL